MNKRMDVDRRTLSEEVSTISSRVVSSSGAVYLCIMKKWTKDGKASYGTLVEDNCVQGRIYLPRESSRG